MKKTLVAVAALVATGAFAQSTVTIGGNVDAGYVNHKIKGNAVSGIDRNLSSTSSINFNANSDLGGGLKAIWRSETDFTPTSQSANTGTEVVVASNQAGTASTFMNGQQFLKLEGNFGAIAFGAINNPALTAHLWSQPFGTAIGSGFKNTSGAFATDPVRLDNSFQFTTADMGGVTAGVMLRPQQAAKGTSTNYNATLGGQAQSRALDLNLSYNKGPAQATLVRSALDSTNQATTTVSVAGVATVAVPATAATGTYTAMVANYNMGNITVYGGYQMNKATAAGAEMLNRTTTTVAAKYVMGMNTFAASVQRAGNGLTTSTGGANLLGLGYEYALSKTAAVVARYERIADQGGLTAAITPLTAQNGDTDRIRMGVGLRVGF